MLDISAFVNKQFKKAIMAQTRLLNTYKKDHSAENLFTYKRGTNLCFKLLRNLRRFSTIISI